MLATPTPPPAQLPDGVAEAEPHTDAPDACYRHLFECALDAVLVIDPERETVLDANPRACELYGFPRAELVGRSLLQLSQNPRRGRAKIAETLATGSCVQFETVQRRKDGTLLFLEVNASRVDWQGRTAILSINRDVTGRKQAERALEESRQLEQLAMRVNRMATWHWDARTGRVTGSASMVTLYGLPAGHHDGTGESWLAHVHQEDREAVRRVWQHACRHAAEFECEYRILLPDGTVRWLAATGTAQRAADRSLQGFLGVCWDVTARHEAESELRASRARKAAILDTALDAILIIDGDGRVVEFNPAAERIFGYGRGEALGRNMADLIVPEALREQHRRGLARHMATGRTSVLGRRIETRAMRADGTEFPVELAITRIEADGPPLFAGTLRDVSGRKQAEQELQRLNGELARRVEELEHSEERYRELFEDAPVSLHEIDCDGIVRRTNRAACGLLGRDPDSILGQPVWDLVAPDEREASRRGVLARLAGSEPLAVFERDYVRPDGRRITAEVRESAITGEDDRVAGLRSSLVDVTERCRLERFEQGQRGVLEMVAQNRLLDEVLERLAHVVEDQLPGTRCAFSLLDQGNLRLLAGPSLPAPVREALADRERGQAPAPGGRVVGDGKVMVADIATEPLWEGCRDLVLHHGLQACWWVPLLSAAGEVLGTCALYVGQAREPEPAELALLEKAGRAAALTVAHRQLTDRLAYLAHHDLLTGLPNRLLFQDRVERAIVHARHHRSRIALLYVDLDNFKLVNDTLGHSVGDALLQQVARRLSGCLRETDTLARMGGDEFTFVITDVINAEAAKLAVQRALASFGEPFHVQGHRLLVRASVGVSLYPRDGECAETLQQHADAAMYQAKERAKGTFQFYAPHLSVKASERLALQADLHRALELGEMELEYQPQAALRDGRLSGFEALLRWRHPRLGLLPPAKFIPIAEETGLIVPIGAWVLGQACRQARLWLHEDHPPVRIAVNVSALQFARQDWVPGVLRTLREAQLDPELLELELTESVVMHDPQEAARQMVRLRKAGVRLAIDDFGTGYSSLSYLHRLPLDRLKIDLSFVREIRSGTQDAPLVHAIIALAHGLGVPVTAEGVETPHQLAVLRELGCDEVQGYLIGRPMPAGAAGSMLRRAAGVPVIC